MSSPTLTFYLARNPHGQFARGASWVDSLDDARLYRTIGPAKSAATKWAKSHPGEPMPHVLEWKLDIASATVVDLTAHVARSLGRIEREKQRWEERGRAWRLKELAAQEARIAAERRKLEGHS